MMGVAKNVGKATLWSAATVITNSVGKNDQCTANQNPINNIVGANNENSISPQFMNGQPNANIFSLFQSYFFLLKMRLVFL